MRKLLCFALILLICFSLCGCFDYRELEDSYVVSAIGFDIGEVGLSLSIEVANNEKKRVFSAEGETFDEAYKNIKKSFFKKEDFSHTACIILGERLSDSQKSQAVDFCVELDNISLAAHMAECENVLSVLESEPGGTAIGYDILSLFKRNKIESLKIYEAERKELLPLPALSVDEEGIFVLNDGGQKDG